MNINRSRPPPVVIPELSYPEVREAVDWLCRAFGFIERLPARRTAIRGGGPPWSSLDILSNHSGY